MKRLIIILFCGLVLGGCKKPVEENIIGTWQHIKKGDKNCCEDTKITFLDDGTITKTRPVPGVNGIWYKAGNEIFIDVTSVVKVVDVTTYYDTCNVTYQIVNYKRNRLFIQDIRYEHSCRENSFYFETLGNKIREYKRAK